MATLLRDSQSNVECGLNTWTHVVANTNAYFVSCNSTDVPPAGLTITVNHNGSPFATATTQSALQQSLFLGCHIPCTAGDTITIVLTSSNPLDALSNNIKSIMIVRQGV